MWGFFLQLSESFTQFLFDLRFRRAVEFDGMRSLHIADMGPGDKPTYFFVTLEYV